MADDLWKITNNWSKAMVIREYGTDKKGLKDYEREANLFLAKGYQIQGQDAEGSHIHAGRLILTGGFSVLAGRRGIRSKAKTTVTYVKQG